MLKQEATPAMVARSQERARRIGVQVLELSGDRVGTMVVYAVPSCTRSGHAYRVTVVDPATGTHPICQCEGYQYRGVCVHSGAVLNRLATEQAAREWSACQREPEAEALIGGRYTQGDIDDLFGGR